MVLEEGIGLAGNVLTTPTPLLLGHTLGGVLIAAGAVGVGIYAVGKVVQAGARGIGVID